MMMTKKMIVNRNKKDREMELIDVLYSSPTKIAAWFQKQCVNISAEDCKKLMIHLDV